LDALRGTLTTPPFTLSHARAASGIELLVDYWLGGQNCYTIRELPYQQGNMGPRERGIRRGGPTTVAQGPGGGPRMTRREESCRGEHLRYCGANMSVSQGRAEVLGRQTGRLATLFGPCCASGCRGQGGGRGISNHDRASSRSCHHYTQMDLRKAPTRRKASQNAPLVNTASRKSALSELRGV
jgi:hypothetical protein